MKHHLFHYNCPQDSVGPPGAPTSSSAGKTCATVRHQLEANTNADGPGGAPGERPIFRLRSGSWLQVAGFTFVELLIALSLSMILILLMLVTFRSALQSMKRIEQIGRENRMLRAGYFQATKDADFWCSQADPNFPYMQQHMSARMATDGATRTFATDRISQGVTTTTGGGNFPDVDSPFDKRPFRGVEWPKLSTLVSGSNDPRHVTAFRLPHDPKSWYRNHIQCNLPSGAFMAPPMGLCTSCFMRIQRDRTTGEIGSGPCTNKKADATGKYIVNCGNTQFVPMAYMDFDSWEECYSWEVQNFFGSDQAYGTYAGGISINPVSNDLWRRVGRKAGWQPWHVVGDYAIVSNCEGLRNVTNTDLDGVADTRSIATWKVFEQLGIFGLFGYTTPGEISLLQVSSLNETSQVIEGHNNTQNYRRGEIPWMLGTKVETLTTRCISTPSSATVNRTNLYGNVPTYMNASREPGCVGAPAPLAIDIGVFNGRNPYCGVSTRQITPTLKEVSNNNTIFNQLFFETMFRHAQPMGLCYPSAPMRTSLNGSWDYTELNWEVMYPLLPISMRFDEIAASLGEYQTYVHPGMGSYREPVYLNALLSPLTDSTVRLVSNEQWRVIRDKQTHQTWHLPRHYEDDPVAPALRAGSGLDLGLATNIRRYRFNGVDHAWCQIMVVDSEGKPVQGLHFKTLSTNFRGARGYWGKKGPITDNFGNQMRIGDYFVQ